MPLNMRVFSSLFLGFDTPMKRIFFLILPFLMLSSAHPGHTAGFSPSQMKDMSVFLSNFTELGHTDFKRADIINAKNPGRMIQFGIWHNYLNNRSAVRQCYQCQWGDMTVDASYIQRTLKRYFDYELKHFPEVEQAGYPYHFDGRRYHFSLIDKTGPSLYARVTQARQSEDGNVTMSGYLYKPGNSQAAVGKFKALARPHLWNRKKTWTIIHIHSSTD